MALGQVDGKLYGDLHQGRDQGPDLVRPERLHGRRADELGRPPGQGQGRRCRGSAATPRPWCVGLESGAAGGWPGTDWIEDIVLRQAAARTSTTQWVAGKQKWTSPEIKSAFEAFGKRHRQHVRRRQDANATNFDASGDNALQDPARLHLPSPGSFITDAFKKRVAPRTADYDFFPFPTINPAYAGAVEGAGDLFGMFNDTPQAQSLMAYLVTPEAQAIWVGRGGALSANKQGHRRIPTTSEASAAEALVGRQDLPLRWLGQHADRHERRVLQGHPRLRQGSVQAGLDPDATSTRVQASAYGG